MSNKMLPSDDNLFLLDCPFCGNVPKLIRSVPFERVYCATCHIEMYGNGISCVDRWNQRHPAPPGGVPDGVLQDAATRSLIVKGLERYKGDIQRAEASGWYDGFTVAQNEIARIDRTIDAILNATPAQPQPVAPGADEPYA